MRAYIDSSVLLRLVLRQAGTLEEWDAITTAATSLLVQVECLRALDRLRLQRALPDADLALRREAVYRLTNEIHLVEPTREILDRASQPFPVSLRTLDAIHLATALAWRDRDESLKLATHDKPLGAAARALGFEVIGT